MALIHIAGTAAYGVPAKRHLMNFPPEGRQRAGEFLEVVYCHIIKVQPYPSQAVGITVCLVGEIPYGVRHHATQDYCDLSEDDSITMMSKGGCETFPLRHTVRHTKLRAKFLRLIIFLSQAQHFRLFTGSKACGPSVLGD